MEHLGNTAWARRNHDEAQKSYNTALQLRKERRESMPRNSPDPHNHDGAIVWLEICIEQCSDGLPYNRSRVREEFNKRPEARTHNRSRTT